MVFVLSFLFAAFNGIVLLQHTAAQSNFTALPWDRWQSATSDNSGQALTVSSYAAGSNFYYSTNGGLDWLTSSLTGSFYCSASSYDSGQYVLVVQSSKTYVSSNYGASFDEVGSGSGGSNCAGVSSTGKYMVYVTESSASSCLSYSDDFGASFTSSLGPSSASGNCVAVAINSAGSTVVVSVEGSGLWTSSNPLVSTSWTLSYNTSSELVSVAYGGGNFYASMDVSPYSILLSTDGAASWTIQSSGPTGCQLSVDNSGTKVLMACYGLYFSQDSGVTYALVDDQYTDAFLCAMNGNASFAVWAGNSVVYYGDPSTLTPTIAPSAIPTTRPTTTEAVFPSDPTYVISQLYSDSGCTTFTSMGSILADTCLYSSSSSNYLRFTCDGTTATNTFYTDSACTVPTGSSTVFTMNTCSVNGGPSGDFDSYMEIIACGVSDPFYTFPDSMPTETYYADTACSEVINSMAYLDDYCMKGTAVSSGLIDWSSLVQQVYHSSSTCDGTYTSSTLQTTCSLSSEGSYGFNDAYYYWQLVSSSTTSSPTTTTTRTPTVVPTRTTSSPTATVPTATTSPTVKTTSTPMATPTAASTAAPSAAPTNSNGFPSDANYVISKLYSDAACSNFSSMGSILTNTCLYASGDYFMFTCDGSSGATNTFYTDAGCTVPTGSSTVFTMNSCSVNGGPSEDYNDYMEIIACGVSNPFYSFPDDMPTATFYADTSCTEAITATAYVDDQCLRTTSFTSGLIDWSALQSQVYYNSDTCEGTYSTNTLTTTCTASDSDSYGFSNAYYYWQLVSSSSTNSGGSSNSMSTGAVAGIAVGGVVGMVALAAVVYFYFFKTSVPLSKQHDVAIDTHKI